MNDLIYSVDARNILNRFHEVDRILYVEGDDDIPFWECIFECLGQLLVKVEEVGGKHELKKYAEKIVSGNADYLIAMDSDYDRLVEKIDHPQIIYTFGYSIENTIVTNTVLHKVLRSIGRIPKQKISVEQCNEWLIEISDDVKSLVFHDFVNHIDQLGISIIGDNCDRFMKSKKSCHFCQDKIDSFLSTLLFEIDESHRQLFESYLISAELRLRDVIRGHFLISAVYRFIKTTVSSMQSSISISRDMLFGSLLLAFSASFNEMHPHYKYYRNSLSSLTASA